MSDKYVQQALIEKHIEAMFGDEYNTDFLLPVLRDRVQIHIIDGKAEFQYFDRQGARIYLEKRFIDDVKHDSRWNAAKLSHQQPKMTFSDSPQPNPTAEPTEGRYGAGIYATRTVTDKLQKVVDEYDPHQRLSRARNLIKNNSGL